MKYVKKNLLSGILLVIVCTIGLDLFSGLLLDRFYKSAKSGVSFQENYIMNRTKQDLLVFGSSRAAYHFMPSILKDSLGYSTYNCGREGTGIYYHYGVLLSTLNRYEPSIIIIDIDYRDIYEQEGIFGLKILKEHAPFYGKVSKEFDSLLNLNGRKEQMKLQSNLYRYNSKIFRIISGNLVDESGNNLGFRVKNGIWDKEIDSLKMKELRVDQNKIRTLEKIIKKASNHNIKLFFSVSPYFKSTPKHFFKPLEDLASKNGLVVLNHLQDQTFLNNKKLFNDELHLNGQGAMLYSSIIAGEMKRYLRKNE